MDYTGYGLVVGAALGLLVGALLTSTLWLAPAIGAAFGLIVGSIIDTQAFKERLSLQSIGMSTPRSRATRRAISYPASACRITPVPGSLVSTRSTRNAPCLVPSATT